MLRINQLPNDDLESIPQKSCRLATSCVAEALLEAVVANFVEERAVGEIEELRGTRPVPRGALERLGDQVALERFGAALDRKILRPGGRMLAVRRCGDDSTN